MTSKDSFGSENHDHDLVTWNDFSDTLKAWLFFVEPAFEANFKDVEKASTPLELSSVTDDTKGRSMKLYAILSSLLKHTPKAILRQQDDRNGFGVWRQLHAVYAPRTQARSMALLNAIMTLPPCVKDKTLREQIQSLERMATEYLQMSGSAPGPDVLPGTLTRVLPQRIRERVQLQMMSGRRTRV